MMVTTKHLLRFLPMDETVRQETLMRMDSYTSDQKLALSELLWSMFYELIDADIKYEFEQAKINIKDGKRELDKNLYRSIEDQVYQRYLRDLREGQESETIGTLREDLKRMMAAKIKNTIAANQQ